MNISRRKRPYKLMTLDVLNIFERPEIKCACALPPGATRRMCHESFEARHYTSSLAEEDMRRIMTQKKRTGLRLNSQGAHVAVASWRLLAQAYDESAWKLLADV